MEDIEIDNIISAYFHDAPLKDSVYGDIDSNNTESNNTESNNNNNNNNNNNENEIILGIDLGTTNSCCAIWRNNNCEIIPDEYGNRTTPSIVAFTNLSRYIGQDAKNQTELNPKNVIYEVKRLMGKKINDESVKKDTELLSYDIKGMSTPGDYQDGNILIDILNKSFSPEEISAMILKKMKNAAEKYLHLEITKAVITVPATFNDSQRQATKDAATIAGLECCRIINEPTAAALAYGLHNRTQNNNNNNTDINIIVYDFGGGTLDVSLLNISNGLFEVLGSSGISHLGGADFDKKIMKYCMAYFKKQHNIENYSNISVLSLQKLRKASENAKIILSTSVKTHIAIKDFHNNHDLFISLSRETFENLCRDLLLIALEPLDDLLTSNEINKDAINEIILVGGMTRMPIIRENIKNYMGREPNCSVNPDEVIAMGAAIQAYMLSNNDNNVFSETVRLLDILPLSLGIETHGGIMNTLIKRNTIIPYTKKRLYTTDTDYETSVLIKIFEGERKMTKDNYFVGEFVLSNIESMIRGIPEIEVTFIVDANGIITVSAEDKETKSKSALSVSGNKGRLTDTQIEKMINEAKIYDIRDRIDRDKRQYYYEIDELCSNIKMNINSESYKLDASDKNDIKKNILQIIEWLKEKPYCDRSEDEYIDKIASIKTHYGTLILKAKLDTSDAVHENNTSNINATSIYGDENNEDNTELIKETFTKIENEEFINIPDNEKNELKELKNSLHDLCSNLFDLLADNRMNINNTDATELRNYIDDTLLWLYIHKATKSDYKMRIDMINSKCDEIMAKYNDIFITSKRDELEQLCLMLQSMILCEYLTINESKMKTLTDKINDILNIISENDIQVKLNGNNQNYDDLYEKKIAELTEFYNNSSIDCFKLNNNINNININNIDIIQDIDDDIGGVSVADIIKQRNL